MEGRQLNALDHLIINLDQGVRTVLGRPLVTDRPNPAGEAQEAELSEAEREETARLMRINHAGEVSAQALYQGQALTARLGSLRERMEQAAFEEGDHLAWCEQRLRELDGRVSYLTPFWYAGSFLIGATAGLAGDKWSLGFVAETERQVVEHLQDHLRRLPPQDGKSRAILRQMQKDEARHGSQARAAGGAELPGPVKRLMGLMSWLMTTTAYRL
jgi:ubiquinone biosynthesis monooxygenase Coq7